MENEYSEWLNNNPVLSYKNGQVLFTESSMKFFVKSFKDKIEEKNNIIIDSNDESELELLFFNIFIKESSEERGIIGNYSVSLSKKDVFGVIIAIAGLIDVFISGVNIHSVIISGGGLIYALRSIINKLSESELKLTGDIALQQKASGKVTVETIVNNSDEYTIDHVLETLHSLLEKDAINWDGYKTSEITIKKCI